MNKFVKLIVSVGICLFAGGIGTIFTVSAISAWYAALVKPSFSPPNYLFAPVWTILYILMGISLYLVWKKGVKTKKSREAVYTFCVQLFLNAVWTPVFFGYKNIFLALIIIILMLFFIIKTITLFAKIDKNAAYLLYPYAVWVSFATILNFSVWILNR
ncbi:MAG: TspO/MBR family protein [Candidatus Microgenomates bacterium]|jgi:tryptophan-rich sensory protein